MDKAELKRLQRETIAALKGRDFHHLHRVLTEAWRSQSDAVITGDAAADLSELLGTNAGVSLFSDIDTVFLRLRGIRGTALSLEKGPCVRIKNCVLKGTKMRSRSLGLNLGTTILGNVTFKNCDLRHSNFPVIYWGRVSGVVFDTCLLKGITHTGHDISSDQYNDKNWIKVRPSENYEYVSLSDYLQNLDEYELVVKRGLVKRSRQKMEKAEF